MYDFPKRFMVRIMYALLACLLVGEVKNLLHILAAHGTHGTRFSKLEINYYVRVGGEITETYHKLSSFHKEGLVFKQYFVLIEQICIFVSLRLE